MLVVLAVDAAAAPLCVHLKTYTHQLSISLSLLKAQTHSLTPQAIYTLHIRQFRPLVKLERMVVTPSECG